MGNKCDHEEGIKKHCCNAGQKMEEVSEMAKEKAGEIKDMAKEKAEMVKEKAEEVREDTQEYIKKNPEKSVGIAAGIGAIFGAIIAFFIGRKK